MTRFLSGLALGSILVLAGCGGGDEVERVDFGTSLKRMAEARAAKNAPKPTQQQIAAAVAQVLQNTTGPMLFVQLPARETYGTPVPIETNQGIVTWGTPDRRTLSTRNGMLVATRGLGDDLMSVEIDQSLAMVLGRRSGTAQRIHRYLDGENQTYEVVYTCSISSAGGSSTETCRAEDSQFTNRYALGSGGQIVQSTQWISAHAGEIVINRLR